MYPGSESDGDPVTSKKAFPHQRGGGQGEMKMLEDIFL